METPILRADLQSAKKSRCIQAMVDEIRRSVLEEAQEGTNTKIGFRTEAHLEEILARVRTMFPDCTITVEENEGTVILVDWS